MHSVRMVAQENRLEAFYRSLGWRPRCIVPDGELRLELDKP
jgi:hypothetical protein